MGGFVGWVGGVCLAPDAGNICLDIESMFALRGRTRAFGVSRFGVSGAFGVSGFDILGRDLRLRWTTRTLRDTSFGRAGIE